MQFHHRKAQALAYQRSPLAVGAGENHQKFLATVAKDHIDIAQLVLQSLGDRFQYFVAKRVAMVVVDALEVIDVEHQQ